jgi:FdhD protein
MQSELRLTMAVLLSLPDRLRKHQGDFARTGGVHAAAIFDLAGNLQIVREDIGRHNAVDKVIGRSTLDGNRRLNQHILLVSGRASFEIVQKALAAGIPIIASVSAPSSLAVNFCRESNQTLIGFLRPPSFNIYSHVERVVLEPNK